MAVNHLSHQAEMSDRIRAAVEKNPRKMTLQLARDLGVPEIEVIRALRPDRIIELDIARWEELLRSLEAFTGKLGEGDFGVVYKGYDDELRRDVAIKVPHRHRVSTPEDVENYLGEARVLASLDHPHIVPVHDVGRAVPWRRRSSAVRSPIPTRYRICITETCTALLTLAVSKPSSPPPSVEYPMNN